MGLRITTWNVNGIRNPFGYQPWRDKRTFEGMFDVLEADIVVFQETKIQRKDLKDDMVLVPGWDCYWSLPKHKKGYSGVVVYTRNSSCSPIRAEEGITGLLTLPQFSTSFRDLPESQQIGGYPTASQLLQSEIDASTLDSEGRCVILEFPAFVLIGTYCPAERDSTRTAFKSGFLNVLDSRIRNLVAMGKRVIWAGDINISREEKDTAMAEEMMMKKNVSAIEWISSPARRLFNQLLVGGIVHGEPDEGREKPVMWDVCRAFHPFRQGMYTCWETKVNARPGNYGARIDYIISSADMRDWFVDSNIQEGLLGSDHCPVYAVFKERVAHGEESSYLIDRMNPPGMFVDGVRKIEWSNKNLLPMSGRLIPEFDRRRSIRDMFSRRSLPPPNNSVANSAKSDDGPISILPPATPYSLTTETTRMTTESSKPPNAFDNSSYAITVSPLNLAVAKRAHALDVPMPASKRSKPATQSTESRTMNKGQQTLAGFFKPKAVSSVNSSYSDATLETEITPIVADEHENTPPFQESFSSTNFSAEDEATSANSRQSWGKLFAKPIPPKCEHDEPCKTMLTKKAGVNCGRSFWMCNRPLGPTGRQERNTQWRCSTFVWASDWDGHAGEPG